MSSLVFLLPMYPRLGTEEADNLETPGDTNTKSPTKHALSGQKTRKGQSSKAEHF